NQASRLAFQHESREELLMVKFYHARRFFRHKQIDLSLVLFDSMHKEVQILKHSQMKVSCELYLAAIQITYFLEFDKPSYINKAQEYIESITQFSKREELALLRVQALYLSAILKSCKSELDGAISDLQDALKLASDTENALAKARIESLMQNLSVLMTLTHGKSEYSVPGHYFLRYGARSFLQEFPLRPTLEKDSQTVKDYGFLFIIQDSAGPRIAFRSHDAGSYATEEELMRGSIAIALAIGQGKSYHQGLFGPFPINTRSNGIVFSAFLRDTAPVDSRADGKNYTFYVLLLPQEFRMSVNAQDRLGRILKEWTAKDTDVRELNTECFADLRMEILRDVFQ
ncbi:MAG TPA: hypothetical protein VJ044_17905, partial [Candidatus Hodarchaeales archaeon]|nr:hypothetical protein [Candidatus Hodarchaeales archaeon]